MSDIEQIKQEVQEILIAAYAGQHEALPRMAFNGYISNPQADSIEFWQMIRNTLAAQAAAAPAEKPKEVKFGGDFTYEEISDGVAITKFSGDKTKDVTIPDEIDGKKVVEIGYRAFTYGEYANVKIPECVKIIADDAFAGGMLTSLTIPDSVESIGVGAFSGNIIAELTLGKGLISIGKSAFEGNKELSILVIPDNVQSIGEQAFAHSFKGDDYGITVLTIGSGVKIIEKEAFKRNRIEKIIFGANSSLESIGQEAFVENKLTELTLPKSVKYIGRTAFKNSTLTSVIIPDDVKLETDERNTFGEKTRITKHSVYEWENANSDYTNSADFVWKETKDGKGIAISKYKGKNTSVNIPPMINLKPVLEVEFFCATSKDDKAKITHLTIPDSVTTILNYAFNACGLVSVTIGKGVKSIGKHAFSQNQLEEITLPGELTSIGENSFSNNKLKSVVIPEGVTVIPHSAFWHNALTNVTLHSKITKIDSDAFRENKLS
ncbi:MAG: leucine-rich repeat domain-containing protein, partial [Treponema sp.]|nr:leucine-rich repeat domain-containing protein [Treponema sp.]